MENIIVIENNKKMSKVMEWYFENKEPLTNVPLTQGTINFQEEELYIKYDASFLNAVVFEIGSMELNRKICSFKYDIFTEKLNEFQLTGTDEITKMQLLMIITKDRTVEKNINKWHALMLFMLHYKEIVEEKESKIAVTEKKKKGKIIKKHRCIPLTRKVYVIKDDFETTKMPIKRNKPNHEFRVRGHYRHYKSGKVVWINEFEKCKGKGNKATKKTYKL